MLKLKKIFSLLLVLTVLGCGFHLRGSLHIPPSLSELKLVAVDPYSALQILLKQQLTKHKIKLLAQEATDVMELHIVQEDLTRNVVTRSASTGEVNQVAVSLQIKYNFTGKNGSKLITDKTITRTREITVSADKLLENSSEIAIIEQELQEEMVYNLLLELVAAVEH